jgi:prephenate dehydrogenase
VIVLAVPMSALRPVAERALDAAPPDAAVLHVSSLQRRDALGLGAARLERVVGTHPMAGTHEHGFAAARAGMFEGATVFVETRADRASGTAAEAVWRAAGVARFEYRTAERHDAEMAWVSHLPQLGATAMAAALAARATAPELVGPGGRDTTRLAESPFELWAEILARAPEETLAALDEVERQIAAIRYSVVHSDWSGLAERWERARAWRRAAGHG